MKSIGNVGTAERELFQRQDECGFEVLTVGGDTEHQRDVQPLAFIRINAKRCRIFRNNDAYLPRRRVEHGLVHVEHEAWFALVGVNDRSGRIVPLLYSLICRIHHSAR